MEVERQVDGSSPFFIACQEGHLQVIAAVPSMCCNGRVHIRRLPPLQVAKVLCEAGAGAESRDLHGATPFYAACAHGARPDWGHCHWW